MPHPHPRLAHPELTFASVINSHTPRSLFLKHLFSLPKGFLGCRSVLAPDREGWNSWRVNAIVQRYVLHFVSEELQQNRASIITSGTPRLSPLLGFFPSLFSFPIISLASLPKEAAAAAAAAKSLQSSPTLCDPMMADHQAPPSLGFSKQEHWSGLPFPSPMHESEK